MQHAPNPSSSYIETLIWQGTTEAEEIDYLDYQLPAGVSIHILLKNLDFFENDLGIKANTNGYYCKSNATDIPFLKIKGKTLKKLELISKLDVKFNILTNASTSTKMNPELKLKTSNPYGWGVPRDESLRVPKTKVPIVKSKEQYSSDMEAEDDWDDEKKKVAPIIKKTISFKEDAKTWSTLARRDVLEKAIKSLEEKYGLTAKLSFQVDDFHVAFEGHDENITKCVDYINQTMKSIRNGEFDKRKNSYHPFPNEHHKRMKVDQQAQQQQQQKQTVADVVLRVGFGCHEQLREEHLQKLRSGGEGVEGEKHVDKLEE
ncbi:hypothetical protein HK098_004405 [Nowakowskiella sp. JEL0407]|nr:hypothetical protein HK098_004405 [Nowakowskiella sp. JEL0407]